ncbi:non-canonical purine NTP pyrophosphatase [Spirobacillus cienkowskii]|uniref:non-canonical purine NTP pyrophosphatase n=1 Tax=Spirobacillus cienkowskii TaxID=495820 RepID=UPI0030CA8D01
MTFLIFTSNQGKLKEFKNILKPEVPVIGINELKKLSNDHDKLLNPIENSDIFLANGFVKVISAITFLHNNLEKTKELNINRIIADDSGLCVPNLHFLPGVHSASFGGEPRDDAKNRFKLRNQILSSVHSYHFKDEKRLKGFFICFLFEVNFNTITNNSSLLIKDSIDFVNPKTIHYEKEILAKINYEQNCFGDGFILNIPFSDFNSKLSDQNFVRVSVGYCRGEVSSQEQNLVEGAGHGYDSLFYPMQNNNLSFASISLEEKNKQSHRAFAMQKISKKS